MKLKRGTTILMVGIALAACGSSTPVWMGGAEVMNMEELLEEAESELRAFASLHPEAITVHSDSKCFFSVVDGTLLPTVKCGPVALLGEGQGFLVDYLQVAPTYAGQDQVELEAGEGGTDLDDVFVRVIPDFEELYRPDGAEVADVELATPTTTTTSTTTTTLPDSPPLLPGEAINLVDTGEVPLQRVDSKILLYGDGELLIDVVGKADRIGSGPDAVIAPDGHELVIWRAEYKRPTSSGIFSSDPRVDASYHLDGQLVALDLQPGLATYALVVNKDSSEQMIEILVDGEVRTAVDMATWSDEGSRPETLYLTTTQVPLSGVSEESRVFDDPFTPGNKIAVTSKFFLDSAEIFLDHGDEGYAGNDNAWLQVETSDSCISDNRWISCEPNHTHLRVRMSDGEEIEPVTHSTGRDTWLFRVPDTETEFTVVASPAVGVEMCCTRTVGRLDLSPLEYTITFK